MPGSSPLSLLSLVGLVSWLSDSSTEAANSLVTTAVFTFVGERGTVPSYEVDRNDSCEPITKLPLAPPTPMTLALSVVFL